MFIYRIDNLITKDFYIGKTERTLTERFKAHFSSSKNPQTQTHLYRAIRKYGIENFEISLVESVQNNINEREQFWISNLNPAYNMTKGGEGGDTSSSPNFIKAMKKYHATKSKESYATYGMSGKKLSEDSKKIISKKNSYDLIFEGKYYSSINEAQKHNPGKSVRRRCDNPKYPNCYRLRAKRICPQLN